MSLVNTVCIGNNDISILWLLFRRFWLLRVNLIYVDHHEDVDGTVGKCQSHLMHLKYFHLKVWVSVHQSVSTGVPPVNQERLCVVWKPSVFFM